MKKEKVFNYEYPNLITKKFENCPGNKFYLDDISVYTKNNLLFVSIESSHSHTSYYVAQIDEKDGKTNLSGRIVNNPDEFGNTTIKNEKLSNFVFYFLFFTILLPVTLIGLLVEFILWIISKIKKEPKEVKLTKEEKLDNIMINKFGCIKIDNNTNH